MKSLPNLLFGVLCLPGDQSHRFAQLTINPLACCICWAGLLGRPFFPLWNEGPNFGSYTIYWGRSGKKKKRERENEIKWGKMIKGDKMRASAQFSEPQLSKPSSLLCGRAGRPSQICIWISAREAEKDKQSFFSLEVEIQAGNNIPTSVLPEGQTPRLQA